MHTWAGVAEHSSLRAVAVLLHLSSSLYHSVVYLVYFLYGSISSLRILCGQLNSRIPGETPMDDCCRSSHILSLTAKKLTALENVGNPLLCRFLACWFLAGSLFKSYFEVVCREQKYDFTHMLKLLLTSIFEIWSVFVPCRYVGRSFVKGGGRPTDILEKLNEMAGFEPTEEIQLYEVSSCLACGLCELFQL